MLREMSALPEPKHEDEVTPDLRAFIADLLDDVDEKDAQEALRRLDQQIPPRKGEDKVQ